MSASKAPLFSFRMVPMIAAQLSVRGIDTADMLQAAKLPASAVSGDVTAPLPRIRDFIDRAAVALKDPLFGMHLADAVPQGAFGLTEFVMRTAPTMQAAIEALTSFAALINPLGQFTLRVDKDVAQVAYNVTGLRDGLGLHLNEYTIRLVVRAMSSVIEPGIVLQRCWLAHKRSESRSEVAKLMGCDVEYGAGNSGFALQASQLQRVPRGHDPALHTFLLNQSRAQLASTARHDIVADVQRSIEARMPSTKVSADDIARALGLSSRSMQRRLLEAGTSYGEVLDHVRQRRYGALQRSEREFDAAHELGFSNQRSVRRCIMRWRGDGSDTDEKLT
jgi:AraC-like DNA-binding protein